MSHMIFMRNRAFIRSIPAVGRDIHRASVEKTRGEIPYLSRADEIARRRAYNKRLRLAGLTRWDLVQKAINASQAAKLARAGKKDELDRLK